MTEFFGSKKIELQNITLVMICVDRMPLNTQQWSDTVLSCSVASYVLSALLVALIVLLKKIIYMFFPFLSQTSQNCITFSANIFQYSSVTRRRKNQHYIPHKELDVCSEEGRYKNHKLDPWHHYSLKSPNDKSLLSLSPPSISSADYPWCSGLLKSLSLAELFKLRHWLYSRTFSLVSFPILQTHKRGLILSVIV